MEKPSYRSAVSTRCASCGVTFDPDDSFLSSAGPVCASCHRRDVQTVRERDRQRTTRTEALLNGVFALSAAAMLSVVAFFTPEGMVPARVIGIGGLSVVALVVCALRAWRFGKTAAHATIGRVMVAVGVLLGTISAITIALRLDS
jgi:hypothetical protein